MNEPAGTSWSPARVLVGILMLGVLIAAGGWFLQDRDTWPRGEALGEALRPIVEGKDPDQALITQINWDNYIKTRTNTTR